MSQSNSNNNIAVRRADFDDAKGLNNMVDICGGVSIFRASFGQYNFASMIESSCLCLVGCELNEKDGSTEVNYSAFLNITDSPSLLGDSQSFSATIEALRPYIPVSVSACLCAIVLFSSITCRRITHCSSTFGAWTIERVNIMPLELKLSRKHFQYVVVWTLLCGCVPSAM